MNHTSLEAWLQELGLSQYLEAFERNELRISDLADLTDGDLQEIGVSSLLARKRILRSLESGAPMTASSQNALESQALAGATQFAVAAPATAPPTADPLAGVTTFGVSPTTPTGGSDLFGATQFVPNASAPPAMSAPVPAEAAGAPPAPAGQPQPAAVTEVIVGQRLLDRYYLVKELGRGGMGVVYKAVDEVTRSEVAIKLLVPSLVGSSEAVSLMLKEAAMAQQLSHPNLLRINHVEAGAQPFIVMEYVDGDTLTALWEENRKKLAPKEVKRILVPLLEGLKYLHERKLVHRDVKPDNVMISAAGAVKLTDYGVASSLRDQREGAAQAGTLLYMSPELLLGKPIDGRSDLYALGIMIYQLLEGRFPFGTSSVEEVKAWHLAPERPSVHISDPVLADILPRLWAQSTVRRCASAAELLTLLQEPERPQIPPLPSPAIDDSWRNGRSVNPMTSAMSGDYDQIKLPMPRHPDSLQEEVWWRLGQYPQIPGFQMGAKGRREGVLRRTQALLSPLETWAYFYPTYRDAWFEGARFVAEHRDERPPNPDHFDRPEVAERSQRALLALSPSPSPSVGGAPPAASGAPAQPAIGGPLGEIFAAQKQVFSAQKQILAQQVASVTAAVTGGGASSDHDDDAGIVKKTPGYDVLYYASFATILFMCGLAIVPILLMWKARGLAREGNDVAAKKFAIWSGVSVGVFICGYFVLMLVSAMSLRAL